MLPVEACDSWPETWDFPPPPRNTTITQLSIYSVIGLLQRGASARGLIVAHPKFNRVENLKCFGQLLLAGLRSRWARYSDDSPFAAGAIAPLRWYLGLLLGTNRPVATAQCCLDSLH
jgi:hypothetical protein